MSTKENEKEKEIEKENSNQKPDFDDFDDDVEEAVQDSEPEDENEQEILKSWGKLNSLIDSFPDFELESLEPLFIGRSEKCQYRIQDKRISSVHCQIYRIIDESSVTKPFVIKLKDLSANGTFVNGSLVGKGNEVILLHGDDISFVYTRKPKSPPPVANFIFKDYSIVPQDREGKSKIHEFYDVQRVLGVGKFATVKLGMDKKTGEKYAIKMIDKKKYMPNQTKVERDRLMDEINILKKIRHPSVVSAKDIFDSPNILYLVIDLCVGGELFDRISIKGRYNEDNSRIVFEKIASAIQYLHRKGIVHRDLKNHLIYKIVDFGLSKIITQKDKFNTFAGTLHFLAPEVIDNKTGYGKECDIWSCGVILYILLSGYMPFASDSRFSLARQITRCELDFPDEIFEGVSVAARNLIRRCLTVDPKKRITAQQILEHPWIKGKPEEIKSEYQDVPNQK
ncbi:serine/threonine-protein kinase fhke-related [Anaeramoeba ignava]|uniref:Serine/threonine-protein kinase fhke-related n=1 Tax=Anaeramoeba ignava TaxID=1746090 RepID=A0A9Q0LHM9_ANAIG|nr:serine/threonine-protein kinase fhke-related [Anaeramoeba ignava]